MLKLLLWGYLIWLYVLLDKYFWIFSYSICMRYGTFHWTDQIVSLCANLSATRFWMYVPTPNVALCSNVTLSISEMSTIHKQYLMYCVCLFIAEILSMEFSTFLFVQSRWFDFFLDSVCTGQIFLEGLYLIRSFDFIINKFRYQISNLCINYGWHLFVEPYKEADITHRNKSV